MAITRIDTTPMRPGLLLKNFALIALMVVAFICYGSLYPFDFQHTAGSPFQALMNSTGNDPGRGDAIANILLYMPLGYFGLLSIRRDVNPVLRLGVVILLGIALSVSMELLQYYDGGRDTDATDVYSNAAGTALGAVLGLEFGAKGWKNLPRIAWHDPAAVMLLAAWTGYNLFPFAPVIDLHKYWDTLKPVLLYPSLTWYGFFTHVAVWTAAAAVIDEAMEGQRGVMWYGAYAGFVFAAKVLIVGGTLSVAEIAGAAAAYGIYLSLARRRHLMALIACLLLGASLIALRLEPFSFHARHAAFGWIPFYSFMRGSVGVNTLSFLEKFFLYGGLIWLVRRTGLGLAAATLSVAALLLATSWAEVYLPGRSAEITDAVMALMIGGFFSLIHPPSHLGPEAAAAKAGA